jgi:hypothetical protein
MPVFKNIGHRIMVWLARKNSSYGVMARDFELDTR